VHGRGARRRDREGWDTLIDTYAEGVIGKAEFEGSRSLRQQDAPAELDDDGLLGLGQDRAARLAIWRRSGFRDRVRDGRFMEFKKVSLA
jgi:hypothetical protein